MNRTKLCFCDRNIIRQNIILAKRTQILQSFQGSSHVGVEFIDENGGGPGVRLR